MTNQLIAARDAFAAEHPEVRTNLNGRDWGVVDVGDGPVLLLMPGTLGRGDIFWQQMLALKDRLKIIAVTYPESGGIAEWCSDLLALMDRLGVSRATVLARRWAGISRNIWQRRRRIVWNGSSGANTLCAVQGD